MKPGGSPVSAVIAPASQVYGHIAIESGITWINLRSNKEMVWQSTLLMSLIDLLIMSIGIYVGYRIYKNRNNNPLLKGSYHRLLSGAGLLLITVFFVADLFTMWVFPQFVGKELAMASMENLHLNISWFVYPMALCLIAAGFLRSETELTQHQLNLEKLIQERTAELEVAMQNANDANQIKSEFLASMSHELRTPLHGILSFSELGLMRHKDLGPEKARRYFDNIHISGSRLLQLVNDLLDISKLSMGKMSLEYSVCDINDIWQQAAQELQPLLTEGSIRLNYQINTDNTECECDQYRILQVISNILSNAIKFSPANSEINCEVSSNRVEYDGNQPVDAISVAISDQGEGIDAVDLDLIFDKFTQAGKPPDSTRGTGLGLAISREIITLHRGRIHAENPPQGGARFIFSIPRAGDKFTPTPPTL